MKLNIKGKEYEPKFGIGFIQRAVKAEKPEGENIMNISTPQLILHSVIYSEERKELECDLVIGDIYDLLDEIGLHDPIVNQFQVEFFNSMRVHLPDEESKKAIDKVVKALTAEQKKKASKSGKKTGK